MNTILLHLSTNKIEHPERNPKDFDINPKDYPEHLAEELIAKLKKQFPDYELIQICMPNDYKYEAHQVIEAPTFEKLTEMMQNCSTWIGIDSMLAHLGAYLNKPGIVLWGQSDPELFGHKTNVNLLKDRKYLRSRQWYVWNHETKLIDEAFVSPDEIITSLKSITDSIKPLFEISYH